MSGRQNKNSSLRRTISLLFMLTLLAVFLSLYLLKYIPGQRTDFHRRAFLELGQIEKAFRERNMVYIQAIQNSINKNPADSLKNNLLLRRYFTYQELPGIKTLKKTDSLRVGEMSFGQQALTQAWEFNYQLYYGSDSASPIAVLSKKVDTVLTPIVSTYRDIFDDYLLILDHHPGKIIFNSGRLSLDYLVNTDSLLKKTDGFSLLNIHDVKVEGNPYKLFLYPVQVCRNRVILAGLISLDHYRDGSESVPLSLLTAGGILLLLLLLILPLLKIYIIGPLERITSLDIRLIIITYFLAAFVVFFLFSLFFLFRSQSRNDEKHLDNLSGQVQNSFFREIEGMCRQLDQYDTLYAALHLTDADSLQRLLGDHSNIRTADSLRRYQARLLPAGNPKALLQSLDSSTDTSSNNALNYFFHPAVYPQMDNVYWIDKEGNWAARWTFEKILWRSRRLAVGDRQYFRDVLNNELLSLPPPFDNSHSFSIQPTLSRVTGEYNINVVIKSNYSSLVRHSPGDNTHPPAMLGISSEMYSVCHSILPPGYAFSIVNSEGDILFDSKSGRSLLSNILTDAGDNTDLRQCLQYRYKRYFRRLNLGGREVALLTRPLASLPYTLIVSYNVSINDAFQFHALSLCCLSMACILALIALTAFFNEWSKKKPSLLNIRPVNFRWLRPEPGKFYYYQHLFTWMCRLFGLYCLSWILIEVFLTSLEPSLFILALSFPFVVAIHYYVIREKYYSLEDGHSCRLHLPALVPLGLVLFLLLVYVFTDGFDGGEKILILFVLALWITFIVLSFRTIKKKAPPEGPRLMRRYVGAILTGILLISLVPAASLFSLFYKEESDSQCKMEKLNMARAINHRRSYVNKRMPDYRFDKADSPFIAAAKFQNGIYFPDTLFIDQPPDPVLSYHIFSGYMDLHEFLFAPDSISLEPPGEKEMAGDSSWYFYTSGEHGKARLRLFYKNYSDRADTRNMRLPVSSSVNGSALGMILRQTGSMGMPGIVLSILGLLLILLVAYVLTRSLSRHIFLIDLLGKYRKRADSEYASFIKKVQRYERLFLGQAPERKEGLLYIQEKFGNYYEKIWNDLPAAEKFILYDFALDGFTNYKAGALLYKLLHKGILIVDQKDASLHIMTRSFHNYILSKDLFNRYQPGKGDEEVLQFMQRAQKQGSWQSFKTLLLILVAAGGLFVFFTQEALFQKIAGLIASIPSLVQGLSSLFEKANGKRDTGI